MTRRGCLALLVVAGLLLAFAAAWLWTPDLDLGTLRARYADETSRFVDLELAGGARVTVHARLEGRVDAERTLVLLHGTASSLHTWDGWIDALDDRLDDRLENGVRIVRYDLPGFGLTGAPSDGVVTIERQIEVGRALLDVVASDARTATLAGNSLGGLVAWRWALAHPDEVDRLVLVAPAGLGSAAPADDGDDRRDRGFRVIDLARHPLLGPLLSRLTPRTLVARALRQVYGDPSRLRPETVDRHHDLLRRPGNRQALMASMRGRRSGHADSDRADPSPADRLSEIHQPTLILWGARDAWIPATHGPRFEAQMPNARLVTYDDAGHVPMEEIPERTARDVAAFLTSTER